MTATPPDPAWWKGANPEQWSGLRAQLRERRAQIAPRYYNLTLFAKERGINYKLAFDVEQGPRRNFDPDTLMAVAAAYEVTYESVLGALRGGKLEPAPPGHGPPLAARAGTPEPGRIPELAAPGSDEDALNAFTQSVRHDLGIAMARYGPGFTGAQAFIERLDELPGRPEPTQAEVQEARVWDGVLMTPQQAERFLAILRYHRVEAGDAVPGHPDLRVPRARKRGAGLCLR